MIKVLFICHGNICRSPMAEFILKDLIQKQHLTDQFEIASAATSREEIGNDIHPGTKKKLTKMHIPFTRRQARQMTKADYESYDYIIAMDSNNLRNLKRIIGEDSKHKVSKLLGFAGSNRDIADPWYTGNFDLTYFDILEGCKGFLRMIHKHNMV